MKLHQRIASLFQRTLAANGLMLLAAVFCYADSFNWLMTPLSWLGKLIADNGRSNLLACIIFCGAMLFNTVMWRRGSKLMAATSFGRQPSSALFSWMVFCGFPFMALPCDRFVLLHSFGGALVVGGLWAYTTSLLWHCRDLFTDAEHLGLQCALHVSALFCGANFFLDTALKGMSQRPLLLAIAGIMALALRAYCYQNQSVPPACDSRHSVS